LSNCSFIGEHIVDVNNMPAANASSANPPRVPGKISPGYVAWELGRRRSRNSCVGIDGLPDARSSFAKLQAHEGA